MAIKKKPRKTGNVNKCGCGRVILHVQTSKTTKGCKSIPCKRKIPKSTKVFRALTSMSIKLDQGDDCSTAASSTCCQIGKSRNENKSAVKETHNPKVCHQCLKKPESNEDENYQPEKKIPLLQRLRVVNADNHQSAALLVRPLPREVVFDQNKKQTASAGLSEKYTECSELGFDGISPSLTMDKKVPTKFTFDGVLPSQSSVDVDDSALVEDDEMITGNILHDLIESERGGRTCFTPLKPDPNAPMRERSRTTSTSEMSIELSADDYFFGTCSAVEDEGKEYSMFSPTRPKDSPLNPAANMATALSKEVASKASSPEDKEVATSWFNFSFLKI